MGTERIPKARAVQDAALNEAAKAARSGDIESMVNALYQSYVLDGLLRQLQKKWPSIPHQEAEDIVAEAVDTLQRTVEGGKQVIGSIAAFLWKVCDRRAFDYNRKRRRERLEDPDVLEQLSNTAQQRDGENTPRPAAEDDELEWDERRAKAIARARELLPRLGQENVRRVMAYIFDALEAGLEDIANTKIADDLFLKPVNVRKLRSRGFERLERIAREEGLLDREHDLADLAGRGDEPEDEEDPDQEDEED